MTRIVYKDPKGTEHEAATLDDGLKFKGDDSKEIAKKLNNTMEIIGGADSKTLTEATSVSTAQDKGQLKVQLAKDLKGITSISNQKTEGDKTTGAKIDLGTDGSVNVNGGKITNVGSGADASGKYTETTNVANIGDVQNIVNDAKTELTNGANGLNKKANIDASNIGANLKARMVRLRQPTQKRSRMKMLGAALSVPARSKKIMVSWSRARRSMSTTSRLQRMAKN